MKPYKITFFENKSQSIQERYFNSYDEAATWGKKNLENFNYDLIDKIQYYNV